MVDIKLLLGILFCDLEVFRMDTTTANIFAVLKPGNIILHWNLPCVGDLIFGLLSVVWKLQAPFEGACPATTCWP